MQDDPEAPFISELRVSSIGTMLTAIGPVSMYFYLSAVALVADSLVASEALVKLTVSVHYAGVEISQLIVGPLFQVVGRRPVICGFIGC